MKIRLVPAITCTFARPLASTRSTWSGGTLVAMSTLPAISSAVRVEASGMARQTIRSKLGRVSVKFGLRSSTIRSSWVQETNR